jgi:hypothetical protein
MTDEKTPAPEAGDEEVVAKAKASEATENPEGQVEGQPDSEDDTEEKTKSAIRREKRKEAEHRLREQAEDAMKKASDAEARLARIKAAAEGEQEPKESDFSDVIEYAAARAVWKQSKAVAQREQREIESEVEAHKKAAEAVENERRSEQVASFNSQAVEARVRYADFDQVIAVATRVDVVSPQLSEMVLDSDMSADVAYHLGRNPALARELSRMPPLSAARELGRIEASLSKPKARTQTNAPDPITPVKPSGTVQRDALKMTHSEFVKWRDAGGTF